MQLKSLRAEGFKSIQLYIFARYDSAVASGTGCNQIYRKGRRAVRGEGVRIWYVGWRDFDLRLFRPVGALGLVIGMINV
jgi:hypothetical protein